MVYYHSLAIYIIVETKGLDEAAATVIRACEGLGITEAPPSYAGVDSAGVDLAGVELAAFDDAIDLRLRVLTPFTGAFIARALAELGAVRMVDCDIVHNGLGGVHATELRIDDGRVAERDVTGAAVELLSKWAEAETVSEKRMMSQSLAAALLDRRMLSFSPDRTLRFVVGPLPLIHKVLRSLQTGAPFEWMKVGERTAIRVDGEDGSRRVTMLSEKEASDLRVLLEQHVESSRPEHSDLPFE